jgi:DNA-binding MurR/RpiR family transcriptional regulator
MITARPHALSAENMDIVDGDSAGDVMQKTFNRNQETLRRTAHMLDEAEVERAVELLDGARQVICLGQGNHAAIAMAAWGQFATVSHKFKVMEDSQLQMIALSTLTKDDVVLYFSYSGASLEIMDAVEVIRAVGAKLILVTRFLHSPAAEFADVLLVYGAEEKPLQYGSAGVLISQLYIVDVLMSCYCMRNMEEAEKNREFIGKVLARKHL